MHAGSAHEEHNIHGFFAVCHPELCPHGTRAPWTRSQTFKRVVWDDVRGKSVGATQSHKTHVCAHVTEPHRVDDHELVVVCAIIVDDFTITG